MKAVILDRETIDLSIDFSTIKSQLTQLTSHSLTGASEIVDRAKGFEIILTNKVVLDQNVISQLPDLKLICVLATGVNNVDLSAAKKAGVVVTNVSGYSTYSVAQHVFAFLLNVVSNVEIYLQDNRQKPWYDSKCFCQIHAPVNELSGKNLGIVGYGAIGRAVALIGTAFGMKVLIAERATAKFIREERVSFDEMLASADVVSIHCPLTKDTQNLFDEFAFAKMKPGSILVNTGRGPIVDAQALVQVLQSKHLGHAIIDVLDQEPPPKNHPLLEPKIPNLTLTHHIAWASVQAQRQLIDGVAENIRAYIAGEKLNRVDPA